MSSPSIKWVLYDSFHWLKSVCENPYWETLTLIAFTLNQSKEFVLANLTDPFPPKAYRQFKQYFKRRRKYEPMAYILGKKYFLDLNFVVNKHTMIPRPETESLVQEALNLIDTEPIHSVLDLGCGCGTIGLSIAHYRRQVSVYLSDISHSALKVCQKNIQNFYLNPSVRQSNLFSQWKGFHFDLICANLPYLKKKFIQDNIALSYEPLIALDGKGKDGLDILNRFIWEVAQFLNSPGFLLIEADPIQMPYIQNQLHKHGLCNSFILEDTLSLGYILRSQK